MGLVNARSARLHDEVGSGGWQGKRIVILGLARQGKALARYLAQRGASVTVSDRKGADELTEARAELAEWPIEYELGGHPASLLQGADALFLSGGVPASLPLVEKARAADIAISNDSQLFLELCPCPLVGITGSAGKSTTTALVGEMARAAGRRAWVGGNIGRPLLADLPAVAPGDLAVLELSSFQLEIMNTSPPIAAVLNITPNHLDRHGTMDNYVQAKTRILAFQSARDSAVLYHDDPAAWELRFGVRGRLISFGRSEPPQVEGAFVRDGMLFLRSQDGQQTVLPAAAIALPGEHNLLNVLAASAIGLALELPVEAMAQTARTFRGLPHRLERVTTIDGVDWYNDSIATTPERAEAGLRAFDRPVVLLAGGRDKGLSWAALARLASQRARQVIAFGECRPAVAAAMQAEAESSGSPAVIEVPDLETAVDKAAEVAQAGDIVLLSPGGTSFDAFLDFEARGDRFKELVRAL